MFVWSKRFAIAGLILFLVFEFVLIVQLAGQDARILLDGHVATQGTGSIPYHAIQYVMVNYVLMMAWVFLWMFDQARVRGVNLWVWILPFVFAPLPTLLVFILFLQRRS